MGNKQILSEIFVQIAGFLIVFFVLKSFAWSRLLTMIDNRRKTIEDTFSDLEKRKQGLEALDKEYRHKIDKIEDAARLKIQEAANAGLVIAKETQEKAKIDAQKIIERAKAEIEQDVAKARLSMRDQIVQLSSLMTEKVIREKLNEKEHQKLVDQFIKEIESAR